MHKKGKIPRFKDFLNVGDNFKTQFWHICVTYLLLLWLQWWGQQMRNADMESHYGVHRQFWISWYHIISIKSRFLVLTLWAYARSDMVMLSIKKHFPRYRPFVRRIHRWPVNSPHKGQWRGALMFSLICAWTNGWVNNRDVSDLRRHRTHHNVSVMRDVSASRLHCHLMSYLPGFKVIAGTVTSEASGNRVARITILPSIATRQVSSADVVVSWNPTNVCTLFLGMDWGYEKY